MIQTFDIHNFGPIEYISAKNLSNINLIIGDNSVGKTFLLKALYAVIRSHEEVHKGNNNRAFKEALRDKLYWTFETEKIGDLVKWKTDKLKFSFTLDDNSGLAFNFGIDTKKQISNIEHNNLSIRDSNSIFLPPKEVLSMSKIIYQAHRDNIFGLDATYKDLILALKEPTKRGKNHTVFSKSRKKLEDMFDGKVEYLDHAEKWIYKKGNKRFAISATAEGIKKIAILDILLGNRFLDKNSILFIDEPEANLHPTALNNFLDILLVLADAGIQIFMTSHSYFVIKKLCLQAQLDARCTPVFIAKDNGVWQQDDLQKGMPDNEIINESIRLFEQELNVWEQ